MLAAAGYEVGFAEDGEEAIDIYDRARGSNRPFDAVILDLTIPGGMGGREAMAGLLSIDPEVKAIVASGYSNDPIMSNYKEYGFKGILAKPFEVGEITDVLARLLK